VAVSDPLRRRSVGAPAVRSVLLTILGEFVLPRHEPVWQETLVGALGAADIKVQAARQALARSTRAGWLVSERRGRRTRLTLSDQTSRLLERGRRRIFGFGAEEPWNGEWLVVILRVPEAQREVRHQLRTQLAWAGFGSLGGGIWITPRVEREAEVAEIAHGEHHAEVVSFRGTVGRLGEPRDLVRSAWDLDAVAAQYERFIADFADPAPDQPEAVFGRLTMLVHTWRKFPFLDPGLPAELLPEHWPRAEAHELFHLRHSAWEPIARSYFETLEAAIA